MGPRLRRLHGRLGVHRSHDGFTLIEILVATSIFGIIAIFVLSTFGESMRTAGRSNERSAATTLGTQVMEQVRASVNPYTEVGFTNIARTPLPLGAPYDGLANPTPYTFELAVTVVPNNDLTITTVTVDVFRTAEPTPFVTLTTILDDQ